MKKVEYTRGVDRIHPQKEDLELIKEFMEDEREDVKYHESYSELMNVFEIIVDTLPVRGELTHHAWRLEHKYQNFKQTFMWHDYKTRKSALYLVIVNFIKWWNKPDRKIIDKHYQWLEKQKQVKK